MEKVTPRPEGVTLKVAQVLNLLYCICARLLLLRGS